MTKKITLLLLMTAFVMTASAQEKPKMWYDNLKFSGYGMLQYQGQDKEGAHTNSFNLRLARFILDGKIGDFDWRAQIQGTNAKGPAEPTVQLVDLYAEWRKYPEFKIRAGQFKPLATVQVKNPRVVVISVSRFQAISSPMQTDANCSTIRLAYTTVRA